MHRSSRTLALLVLAMLDIVLTACAVASAPPLSTPVPPVLARCSAEGLASLVGKPASAENIARAQRQSGATLVRVIKPGQMVTADFREDRLDIRVDTSNVILHVGCG
ncbi:I78 family peptidase inhibitor [Cognatilysobacter lacus]|uniref:Peptidase inhibitor I78 family protein n=1 Tax=Cognatilysobacter lacus TaxID=1643323 RepID=A0A5D8YZ39_9GAMM|nr:I78 family peptidase inhibitor [Lysobacter lacus]TZF87660.1 hypothetical protein FW784_10905 [Lysobacter lacus]